MSVNRIHAALNQYYSQDIDGVGFINPNFIVKGSELTWANRLSPPTFDSYEELFSWVISNHQISLGIEEGVFQFYYRFSKGELAVASVSFYTNPDFGGEYFRVDFDPDNHRPHSHSACHMHTYYDGDLFRIPIEKMMNPIAFIQWVIQLIRDTPPRKLARHHYWGTDISLSPTFLKVDTI